MYGSPIIPTKLWINSIAPICSMIPINVTIPDTMIIADHGISLKISPCNFGVKPESKSPKVNAANPMSILNPITRKTRRRTPIIEIALCKEIFG